ncbi:MAG: Phage portal protein Gp6-like, partial [Phycisphaerales bacterium]|nr:Phage portal protein Gp6-like [Phycisphaerales bacterium]
MKTEIANWDGVDRERLAAALDRLIRSDRPRYRRLWAYFKNSMRVCGGSGSAASGAPGSERPYRQAQEWGLPPRITGMRSGAEPFAGAEQAGVSRKEVVIENDIGWRIDTMVDYLFGKPLVLSSAAPDPKRRALIGKLLRMILAGNGGIHFLQQLATLGSVYGFVDVLV